MVDLSEEDLLDYHEIVTKTFSSKNEGHQSTTTMLWKGGLV
jgi:hypothetical protein